MHITIDHETVYGYDVPVSYSIQSLRLTPQPYDGQAVRSWWINVEGAGTLHRFTDSYGNVTHTLVLDRPHREVRVRVRGQVVTAETGGLVTGTIETFPPVFYLRPTPCTKADGALDALARSSRDGGVLDSLHRLMMALRDAIDYRTGETDVMTTAAEALANGAGVCQDHAHAFIAAARSIGVPARYVSGYLLSSDEGTEGEAAHAWAEALVPDLGWVGFDVANRVCATDRHVRVAIGLDYQSAAPVRGIRRGGGEESLSVAVRVNPRAAGSAQ